MFKFGQKESVAERAGEEAGLLFAILLFSSVICFILNRAGVIHMSKQGYLILLGVIFSAYVIVKISGGIIKTK